ncbi:MAG: FAD-dependent oxidoreductase [Arhodomonas sp.]|nr:FAD-dependent oxidoreductase [Arhodomonas sp.]
MSASASPTACSAFGRRVVVLDEGDDAFRASRGNFGLVWVQGKGLEAPAYARWTRRSAAEWRDFAGELSGESGVDLALAPGRWLRLSSQRAHAGRPGRRLRAASGGARR